MIRQLHFVNLKSQDENGLKTPHHLLWRMAWDMTWLLWRVVLPIACVENRPETHPSSASIPCKPTKGTLALCKGCTELHFNSEGAGICTQLSTLTEGRKICFGSNTAGLLCLFSQLGKTYFYVICFCLHCSNVSGFQMALAWWSCFSCCENML